MSSWRSKFTAVAALASTCLLAASLSGANGAVSTASTVSATSLPHHAVVLPSRSSQADRNSSHGGGSSGTTTALSYQGGTNGIGVTTGQPQIYVVFWGSQWGTPGSTNGYVSFPAANDPMQMAPYLQSMYQGLGTDGELWSGVATQYCQGVATGSRSCPSTNTAHVPYPTNGVLAGVWADESSAAPSAASLTQIGNETVSAAAHFGNTSATSNRNTQYVLVSPTGTHPNGFSTPNANWCAWHDYTADLGVNSPYGALAMTNLPYLTDLGSPSSGYLQGWECGAGYVNGNTGQLDGISIVAGHEYAETLTDQNPSGGWIVNSIGSSANGEEIGDLCAWIGTGGSGGAQDVTMSTGSFAMQGLWSNADTGCRIADPIITNGTGTDTITVTTPPAQTVPVTKTIAGLQIVATDSGGNPMAFSLSGGALPNGLLLSGSGKITGTPTTVGSSSATVTVSDGFGASATTTVTYKVTSLITVQPVSVTVSRGGHVNVQVQATDIGGTSPVFALSGLPGGITISSTGLISGTAPTKVGTYTGSVTVSDTTGGSGSAKVSIRT